MKQDSIIELTTTLAKACGYEWFCLYRTKDEPMWCAEGCEGFFGLEIIANSMATEFIYSKPTCGESVSGQGGEFEAKLNALKREEDTSFIAYFQLTGNLGCRVAWSDHLDREEVYQETITFIRCGIMLER